MNFQNLRNVNKHTTFWINFESIFSKHNENVYPIWFCFCFFDCLSFRPIREFFTYMEKSPLPMKGCKFLPSFWPGSEGSSACRTYCDRLHPYKMVISEDPWHKHLLRNVLQWSCHYLFLLLSSVAALIPTANLPHTRRTL